MTATLPSLLHGWGGGAAQGERGPLLLQLRTASLQERQQQQQQEPTHSVLARAGFLASAPWLEAQRFIFGG